MRSTKAGRSIRDGAVRTSVSRADSAPTAPATPPSNAADAAWSTPTSDADAATVASAEEMAAADTLDAALSCPSDMLLVQGRYCPEVQHHCLEWLEKEGPYAKFRCAKYGASRCLSAERRYMKFCIDRDEYTKPGERLPLVSVSWGEAAAICSSLGKRICLESEWQFACEGEEMLPYPYGYVRNSKVCNIDQPTLGRPQEGLADLRRPAGADPRCSSPFGIHDMSGNVEEWATMDEDAGTGSRATMKGAWWLPGRNHCRAATVAHGGGYAGPQVGIRCCKNAH